MNKVYINSLVLFFAMMLVSPSLALASWWNPLSWLGKEIENVEKTSGIDAPTLFEESQSRESLIPENKNEEKGAEMVPGATTFSALQSLIDHMSAQIKNLIKENESLRNEIKGLREENNQLTTTSPVSPSASKEDKWCSNAKTEYHDVKVEIEDLETNKITIQNSFKFCGTLCHSELDKVVANIAALETKKQNAQEDIDSYCE